MNFTFSNCVRTIFVNDATKDAPRLNPKSTSSWAAAAEALFSQFLSFVLQKIWCEKWQRVRRQRNDDDETGSTKL